MKHNPRDPDCACRKCGNPAPEGKLARLVETVEIAAMFRPLPGHERPYSGPTEAMLALKAYATQDATSRGKNAKDKGTRKGLSLDLLFSALNSRAAACWAANQKPGADLVKAEVRWKTDVAARMGIKGGWRVVAPYLPKWYITEAEIVDHLEKWRKPMPSQ